MTQAVAFKTPGLIPLDSCTTFGVNAKPMSTSPFGYFGTGLKYAIAVLLRHGCKITLWRGNDKYTFYTKREQFRDKTFDYVKMKREAFSLLAPKYSKLPFTLELGKNWELWQAFRELETNTRDENGETVLTTPEYQPGPYSKNTVILVESDRFVDEFHDMGKHFLVGGKTVREDEAIQIIDKPSSHIYYRGVRIMDLKEEAQFTYNILAYVELTEDRTAKYGFLVESMIADYIASSEDPNFVNKVVHTNRWESRGLSYGYASATPSSVFRSYAPSSQNPTAQEYLKKTDPSVSPTTTLTFVIPKPEITPNELMDVCRVVCETLGVPTFEAKNLTSGDEMIFDEGQLVEPPPMEEEDLVPF